MSGILVFRVLPIFFLGKIWLSPVLHYYTFDGWKLFTPVFRPPFEYRSEHLNIRQVKVGYSDVCYSDPTVVYSWFRLSLQQILKTMLQNKVSLLH